MIDIESLNKAIMLTQKGVFKEAEELYLKLYDENPEEYLLLSSIGLFYVTLKDYEKASEFLEKACSIKETLGTVSALGFAEYERGNYRNSAGILIHSLTLGENPEIYNKLILSLFHIEDFVSAIKYSEEMYEKYPQEVNSTSNMIKALIQQGKMLEAEKMCVEYLRENPDIPSLWFDLGFLKELIYSDDNKACECFKVALDLGAKEAYYNIASSYNKLGKYEKAEEYYNKMLECFPEDNTTEIALGLCNLAQKKFREGYDLVFKRKVESKFLKFNNRWKFGDKFEKELVVYCDQGFGDHIQFVRYLPFLREKVEKLYVVAHRSLIELFQLNYANINFIEFNEANLNMQALRITDLAYILDMDFDNIPFSKGYLSSDTADIKSDKLKVGLCWEAGAAGIRTMINRTININLLEPIMNLENIQLYSFQVTDSLNGNERYADKMINLAKDFKSFKDTAEALKAMDVVITVDTSVAHLAGALGVKTFLMLPYATDWRWFEDTKTTPWYDSVELFKQKDSISWENVIEDIICRLKEYSL